VSVEAVEAQKQRGWKPRLRPLLANQTHHPETR
jgi:hypothetical protein